MVENPSANKPSPRYKKIKQEPVDHIEIKKEADHGVVIKDEPVEGTSIMQNYETTVKKEMTCDDEKTHETTVKKEKNDEDKKPNNKRAREENSCPDQEDECQLCDELGHIAKECYRGYRYCRDWEYGNKDCKGVLIITNSKSGRKRFSCQFGCKGIDGSAFHMLESWRESSWEGKCGACGETGKCVKKCRWQGLKCKKKDCNNTKIVMKSYQKKKTNYGKWFWNCIGCYPSKGERNEYYWVLTANYEREVATDPTITQYWSNMSSLGFRKNKVNPVSSWGRDYFRYEGSPTVNCQVCGDRGHRADKCNWAYKFCDYCDSICVPSTSRTDNNPNSIFLNCQNHTCPKEFRWQGLVMRNSVKCSYCGVPDHCHKNCQWKGLKCRKKNCDSIRVLKVSDKEETLGRRYLECEECSDFQWFWYANFERSVCWNPQTIKYWSANNVLQKH